MSHSGSGQSSSEASAESSGGPVRLSKSDFGRKHRKIVRILTVVAYIISVSTAAVLLSAYYVFLWKPTKPNNKPTDTPTTMAMASPQTSAYVGLPSGLPLISFATAASQSLYPFSSSSSKHVNSQRPHMSSTLLHHHGHGSISSDRSHSPQPPTPQSFFMQKLLENITDPPLSSSFPSPTPSNDTFNFNNTSISSETTTILTPKTTTDQLTTTATTTTATTTTTTIKTTTKAPSFTTAPTTTPTTDPITTTRGRRSTLKPAKKASTFKSSNHNVGMLQPTTPHSLPFNANVNTKKNNTVIH